MHIAAGAAAATQRSTRWTALEAHSSTSTSLHHLCIIHLLHPASPSSGRRSLSPICKQYTIGKRSLILDTAEGGSSQLVPACQPDGTMSMKTPATTGDRRPGITYAIYLSANVVVVVVEEMQFGVFVVIIRPWSILLFDCAPHSLCHTIQENTSLESEASILSV